MMTRTCLVIMLVALVALMVSTVAWGDSLTVGPSNNINDITFHSVTNTYTCPLGDVWGPLSLTVPKFNTALGTLTGVSLTLTTTLAGDRALTGATDGYYRQFWSSVSTLDAPGTDLIDGGASYPMGFEVATGVPLHILGGEAQASGLTSGGPPVPVTSSDGWANWKGAGSISLDISSVDNSTRWEFSDDGINPFVTIGTIHDAAFHAFDANIYGATGSYLLNVQSDDVMSVTYTYDARPIPEPGTLALMALGLPGLAMWARRRRRNK